MQLRTPYLGPDTYELEHRDLFFGRNAEGRVVASMIAAQPVSILTGASGTGKSSLLRAQIIPTLISRGWCAVYGHSQGNPQESLATELIRQTLPDPEAEQQAMAEVIAAADGALDWSSLLSQAAAWFEQLPRGDLRRSRMLHRQGQSNIPHYSLTALLIAGIISPLQFSERFSMVAEFGGTSGISGDPAMAELVEHLPAAIAGRRRLEGLLTRDRPSLTTLAERVWSDWAKPLDLLGVVLILDQGEELYTSFGASGHGMGSRLHDWHDRETLFEELPKLVEAAQYLPLRLCFSLRPEWYASLRVSLDRSAPDEAGVYFLRRFDRDAAAEAIEEPAIALGSGVSGDALEFALHDMSSEADRGEIDPFLLAIVFHIAWQFVRDDDRSGGEIGLDALERIAAGPEADDEPPSLASGAMRWLLYMALDDLDEGAQFDCLEMLLALFNEDGTRRTLPEDDLVQRPLRDHAKLRAVLDCTERAGLIRRFRRGDLSLVEVRHERIAAAVFHGIASRRLTDDAKQADWTKGRYRSFLNRALQLLMTYDGGHLDAYIAAGLEDDPLPAWASDALRANHEDVLWDQPAARVFLASLLHSGPTRKRSGKIADDLTEDELSGSQDHGLDWDTWLSLVAKLVPLASRRLQVDPVVVSHEAEQRHEFETSLLRGARLKPDSAAACLAADLPNITRDAKLALLRSILSSNAPDIDRALEVGIAQ